MATVGTAEKHFYEFGPFLLDAEERILLRDGVPVPLAPKALEVLLVLVANYGHIVEKEEVMKRVWTETFVEEANLTQNVSVLRKILGEGFIETVPRRGYRFVAPVKESDEHRTFVIEERTSSKLVISAEDAQALTRTGKGADLVVRQQRALVGGHVGSTLWPRLLIASGFLLATAVSAYFLFHQAPRKVRSIAVLPLRVVGEEDQSFGGGITDSLIRQLGGLKEIKVRPTEEVMKYGGDRSPIDAGRELKVDAVLEGTVQKVGDQARTTVRLWRVDTGKRIGEEIKRNTKVTDLLAAEDSIAEQVARALKIQLTSEQRAYLEKRSTEDSLALRAYAVGRYDWSQRNFVNALNMFDQAVKRDPNYAEALAGIADCYAARGSTGDDLEPKDTLLKAKDYALKARELEPDLPEAHTSLGIVHLLYDWDLDGAEGELKRALELNPSSQAAQFWYTVYLTAAERFDESISEAKKAEQSDPSSSLLRAAVARALYYAKKYDEAAQQARIADADSDGSVAHYIQGKCYERNGMYQQAIEEFNQVAKETGNSSLSLASLATAYALAGNRKKDALQILAQLEERSKSKYVSPVYGATIWAALGNRDKAFELLDSAFDQRASGMIFLKIEPTLDSLRADPRFNALIERIKTTQR